MAKLPIVSLVRALGGSGLVGATGFGVAAVLVVLVAALDEHNQARIGGRSGRPEDVGVDFGGFLLFSSIMGGVPRERWRWRSAAYRAPAEPQADGEPRTHVRWK
ncbi:MAG: VanZ family protein [Desulfotomaculales bacterium]